MSEKTVRHSADAVAEPQGNATDDWLAELAELDRTGIDHDTALRAVTEAKADP